MAFYSLLTITSIHLLVPGPDLFLVLRTSLVCGYKGSVLVSLGVGLGIVFWLFLAAFGLNALFVLFPTLQILIMSFGAMYLFYLSFLLAVSIKSHKNLELEISTKNINKKHLFWTGFLTNLSNPKAILYFASIFLAFIDKSDFDPMLVILVVIISIESVLFSWYWEKYSQQKICVKYFLRIKF